MKVTKFGERIRELRENQNIFQRQLAASMDMDTAMLSKIEKGVRKAKKDQVTLFAELLKTDAKDLLTLWCAEQVFEILNDDVNMDEVFNAAKAMQNK